MELRNYGSMECLTVECLRGSYGTVDLRNHGDKEKRKKVINTNLYASMMLNLLIGGVFNI